MISKSVIETINIFNDFAKRVENNLSLIHPSDADSHLHFKNNFRAIFNQTKKNHFKQIIIDKALNQSVYEPMGKITIC
jgi:hypothetical protein